MKVVIVFNHPYHGSYCNAILNSVTIGLQNGSHEVDLIHLDNEGFNPVMTVGDLKAFRDKNAVDPKVLEYKNRIEQADHLIFIFPMWWELMPAMTKGFIEFFQKLRTTILIANSTTVCYGSEGFRFES